MATVMPPGFSAKTVRKALIVTFIEEYLKQRGHTPTLREIAIGIGLDEGSYGVVHQYANELIEEGKLRKSPGRRTLTLA